MSNSEDNVYKFEGTDADVTWDGRLCIHVAECGGAAGNLFVNGRQPWCQPDLASAKEIEDIVQRCPTGAISYRKKTGQNPEKAAKQNTVIVSNNGPLYIKGELNIDVGSDDMPGIKFRAALCRCGHSKNKPFCDNSHEDMEFRDRGSVGNISQGTDSEGGPLVIRAMPNGPLLCNGNFSILAASGRVAWQGKQTALCRCGASKNKPFCDGSHTEAEFKAD